MRITKLLSFGGMIVVSGLASATNLLFATDAGAPISQTQLNEYGDRVTAISQNGLAYGAEGGFTPNVVLDYTNDVGTWGTGYGNFSTAIWGRNATSSSTSDATPVSFTLTADSGFLVRLRSIRLADWNGTQLQTTFRVLDGSNNELFNWQGIPDGTTSTLITFPSVVGESLTVTWNNGWNTGGRELVFSQEAVPEPATMTVLGVAALAILRKRRK